MRLFAWGGGALFVIALAHTAFLYELQLGVPRPFAGWAAVGTDAVLFSMFAMHHSIFARDPVKRAVERVLPGHLLRSAYVWIASVLLILVGALWQYVGGIAYSAPAALGLVFVLLQTAGLALTVLGVRAIDPLELAGIRAASGHTDDLQVRGAYRVVRHPLYLGWMLMVFAAPRMTGDRLTFAIVTSAYLLIAIPWEERSLEGVFGDAYRRYKERVRWRVLPYVY
jgi:protein-S-isoprenylcysteine O-methyltransferase Ste14